MSLSRSRRTESLEMPKCEIVAVRVRVLLRILDNHRRRGDPSIGALRWGHMWEVCGVMYDIYS